MMHSFYYLGVKHKRTVKSRFYNVSTEVLWGLVNNAGVSTFGEVEWVSDNTYRKLLEVNTLGTIAATKAFLPFIRRAKG